MKKKIKIILFISLISVLLIISFFIFLRSKKLYVLIDNNKEVSINSKVYNTDYIKKLENGTIISKKQEIDTTKVGEQSIRIIIKDFFGKEKEFFYKIKVYDNVGPIIKFNKELITEEGIKIDLLKDVIATDNSNEKMNVSVLGDYDFNKPDSYKLYYTAKDSSGNETKEKFTLIVKPKKIIETPKSETSNDNEVTFTTANGFSGYIKNGVTYIDGVLIVNKTYSLPSTYGNGLTNETELAFSKMQSAALLEGLNIYLSSGYRSYNTQKSLYKRYVNRDGVDKADTYSARAGHSEHQSGLAFDVNQINDTFNNTKEAKWLADNCYKYGFILRYPEGKTNETGYKYESWHFRYVGVELATKLYNNGAWITLESYFGITSEY